MTSPHTHTGSTMNQFSSSIHKKSSFSFEIVSPGNIEQVLAVKELVWEYFCWGNTLSVQKKGFNFNIQRMFLDFIESLYHYKKPTGILYLLRKDSTPIGVGGFKKLSDDTCELKRMYIRESFRKSGLGNGLLQMLIENAKKFNYVKMKLETARFMEDAYILYQKFGFKEIPIYSEAESPEEYQSIICCMELMLR